MLGCNGEKNNMTESQQRQSSKIPLPKALLYILLSVVLVSGSCGLALFYYQHIKEKRFQDPDYEIIAIVQSTADVEGLNTVYLAELLNLSVDYPINFYQFNTKEAQRLLLKSPVIKEAMVRKIPPGTVHIDYSLRRPIGFLADYSNAVVDTDGVVFPLKPFFRPKNLPLFYLGQEEGEEQPIWGAVIKDNRTDLLFAVFDVVSRHCCNEMTLLRRIDISKAFAPSYGQRQIVLELEERCTRMVDGQPALCSYPRMLRLSPDNYQEQLSNYLVLRTHLKQQEDKSQLVYAEKILRANMMVIDLRLSDLAFIH